MGHWKVNVERPSELMIGLLDHNEESGILIYKGMKRVQNKAVFAYMEPKISDTQACCSVHDTFRKSTMSAPCLFCESGRYP